MNMIKFLKAAVPSVALALFVFGMPQSMTAQGRYANVYSRIQVKGFIDRLERSSNTFRRDFDRYMDRSNLNGTPTEDEFNGYVANFESSVNTLQRDYNRSNNWWENRSNVQSMLNAAQPVNTMINRLPFARNIERQWRAMRDDINKVADTFDMPGLNGGGWNGGGGGWNGGGGGGWNGGNGQTSTPPSWAQGTFRWIGTDARTMTIDRNGRVSVTALGRTTYGTYYRDTITINGGNLRVSRGSNGIRLYNPVDGGTAEWRVATNESYDVGDDNGGAMSAPPTWARGTFTWIGSDPRTMTIDRSGRVSVTALGNTTYGTYYRDVITINGGTLRVTRTARGIRLYNPADGGTADWVR
jgi:hypothetical protein